MRLVGQSLTGLALYAGGQCICQTLGTANKNVRSIEHGNKTRLAYKNRNN